jgi:hypothetical protein
MPPTLGVTEQVVIDMNGWLSGDASLNAPIRADSDSGEWLDWLNDEGASQETALAASDEFENRRKALASALAVLNDRERGIDANSFEKVQKAVKNRIAGSKLFRRWRCISPRGGRNCRRECSLSTAKILWGAHTTVAERIARHCGRNMRSFGHGEWEPKETALPTKFVKSFGASWPFP